MKTKIQAFFLQFTLFLFVYMFIGLTWVGAEYVFEGIVHSSNIDSVANLILALYIFRDMKA